MTNRAEKVARELAVSRDLHKTEVAFIKAHPIHTQEVGEQKAKEFIANLTALTEHIEKNWNRPSNESDPFPVPDRVNDPAHEVEVFFTPEQRAEVAALHARMEHVDLLSKAQSYDELLDTLEKIGLCPDDVSTNGGLWSQLSPSRICNSQPNGSKTLTSTSRHLMTMSDRDRRPQRRCRDESRNSTMSR
jgi:hypothetical protein